MNPFEVRGAPDGSEALLDGIDAAFNISSMFFFGGFICVGFIYVWPKILRLFVHNISRHIEAF